jgi:hypothetical protein
MRDRAPKSSRGRAAWTVWLVLGLAITSVTRAPAQQNARVDSATPGARYEASGLYQWLFGSSYRDVWTTPITVEVLDLRTTGGGLTPTGTGGGQQTLNLRFVGTDGLPYTFRGLDKDPTSVLPPALDETFAEDVVQDQVSSAFPTAPPVVEVLLEAVGIKGRGARLVIMPDDTLLGEYREQFAGRLGTIETWANERDGGRPGFADATDVISTDELWQRFLADPSAQVDLGTFLKARLVDILVGDWDRHRGQWRWGNIGPGAPPSWSPFPEDRDQAFARYDGLLLSLAGPIAPQLTKFGATYPRILGATWNGRDLDRWLLPRLPKAAWDSVVATLETALTDDVIDRAVDQLPESHRALRGAFLRESLRSRRDGLAAMAESYYRHVVYQVDLQLTDVPEDVRVIREDGSLRVAIHAVREGRRDASPYLVRRFDHRHTREVRLLLRGGEDRVNVSGSGGGVVVRIVSTEGVNTVVDSVRGKRSYVYDNRTDSLRIEGAVDLDDRKWDEPEVEPGDLPPRDWGSLSFPFGWVQWTADLGLTPVVGYERRQFGFRKQPFAQQHKVSAAVSFKKLNARGVYDGVFIQEGGNDAFLVQALASGIEINNFYGFGNATSSAGGRDLYKTDQNDFRLNLAFRPELARGLRATMGVGGRFTMTSEDDTTLVVVDQPYGIENFGQIGATAGIELDLRNRPVAATKGLYVRLGGSAYPGLLSAADSGAFGEINGIITAYVTPVRQLTMALRAGGKRVWGPFPFQESAFLGGLENLRGYRDQRFAGDASLYFNSDLRLHIAELFAVVPANVGLVGVFDVGRVWYQGVSAGEAHFAYGGGISFAPLKDPRNALVLAAAGGDDGTVFFFQLGWAY